MLRPRAAAKGGKLEKPRPLRTCMIRRSVSENGPVQGAPLDIGTTVKNDGAVKTESSTHQAASVAHEGGEEECELVWLRVLVGLLEGGQASMLHILDLCTLLQDRGARWDNQQPGWMSKCFTAVRQASKRDSMIWQSRILLLDLLELRARAWRKPFCPVMGEPPVKPSADPTAHKVEKGVAIERNEILETSSPVKPSLVSTSKAFFQHYDQGDCTLPVEEEIQIRWDSAGQCGQCELVLSDHKLSRVCGKSEYRLQVIELLTTCKITLTKEVVWNHRQIILRGKQDNIRKAARLLLDMVNAKTNEDMDCLLADAGASLPQPGVDGRRNMIPSWSPWGNTVNPANHIKQHEQDVNCNIHSLPNENTRITVPEQCPEPAANHKQVKVHVKETEHKAMQTESSNPTSVTIQPAVAKWEQQCLLQFSQGTLCLCTQDKALLVEAKENLRAHFCPLPKRQDLSSSSQKSVSDHSTDNSIADEIKLKRSRFAEESGSTSTTSQTQSFCASPDNSFVDPASLSKSRVETVSLMRNNSTPEHSHDNLRLPFGQYQRVGSPGQAREVYKKLCKSANSTFDEQQFSVDLLEKRLSEHDRSDVTPDITPDVSPVVSPSMGYSGVRAVQIRRQPIMPDCAESDLELLESDMPSGLYSPRGRRAMFKRYSDQVTSHQSGGVQFQIGGSDARVSYSWGELLSCASSPLAQTCPSEWSYLSQVYPEVCLLKVSCYFDPTAYAGELARERQSVSAGQGLWGSRTDSFSSPQMTLGHEEHKPCQIRGP